MEIAAKIPVLVHHYLRLWIRHFSGRSNVFPRPIEVSEIVACFFRQFQQAGHRVRVFAGNLARLADIDLEVEEACRDLRAENPAGTTRCRDSQLPHPELEERPVERQVKLPPPRANGLQLPAEIIIER